MTNEEAKMFLDNLKVCIDEHPVVADWLVEIANRKTEPNSSEIPNSSTISKMEQVDKDINVRSKDEPQTEVDWKQRLCDMYGADRKSFDEAWRKYEADKVKDEPQTERSE